MNTTSQQPRVEILPTLGEFETAAAETILSSITEALRDRNKCLLGLSGGNTPREVYRHLGKLLVAQSVDVTRLHLIFVDERMVPPDDPASNYKMVQHELIEPASIPPSNVHRIKGELNPEIAASEYERELKPLFSIFNGRCDLIVLGVGADGHTASLFPGSEVLHEHERTAGAVFVPNLNSWRVTLTLPVINRSQAALFLVAGEEKAAIVGKIFANTHATEDMPATMVSPETGTVKWMLDAKAASKLPLERLS
ncbi:MAG TPA: 6-phosphogluconolactonase [Bacteroidota bacterium]|nr:6-phosphogluconolactonase [Bacteroidota bacterium]